MKKKILASIISFIFVLVLATAALAGPTDLPGSGWWSGQTIQNIDSSDATMNIVAYEPDSATTYTISGEILTPGESKVYIPTNFPGMPAGFQGSAIVSASQDVRAVVNLTNRYISSLGLGDPLTPSSAAGLYQGIVSPGTTVRFPLVKSNHYGKTTSFAVQNAGGVATTVTATFKLPISSGGPIGTYTYTSPSMNPGQMVLISPADSRDGGDNPPASGDGIFGGLTVQSNTSAVIAGSAMEYNTAETNATLLQATRGYSLGDYDDKWYAPTIKHYWFNRFTGLLVQNVSGGSVNVTATYKGTGGTCDGGTYTSTVTGLGDGETHFFNNVAVGLPTNCLASATIDATGDIVAIVNEAFVSGFTNSAGKQEAISYNCIPDKLKTSILSVPLYKEDSYSKQTGLVIQNVGTANATNVILTFKGPTGTYVTNPLSIDQGKNIVVINVRFQPAGYWNGAGITPAVLGCTDSVTACGANGQFGVVVTSDQPVVAQANESTYPISSPRILQDKNSYEGFNLTAVPGP